MPSLSDIVSITIVLQTGGITQAGFGTPLLLSHSAAFAERVRFYQDPEGVAADFAVTTPEHRAASKIFSQNPRPERVAIGRAALKPTQRFKIGAVSVQNLHKYIVKIGTTDVEYTSDGTATNDEIVAGLAAAITTLAPAGFAATAIGVVGSQVLQILASAPGNWLDITAPDPTYLSFVQDHADPGVATDLTAIKLESNQWYHLVTWFNSEAYVLAASAFVEANKKLYTPDFADSEVITVAESGLATDVAHDLKASAFNRTGGCYHPNNAQFFGAAWPGAVLPLNPGSETWKFKTLAGVAVYALSETQKINAQDKRCNLYLEYAGRNIATEGVVASGQFVDTIRFRDWLEARIQERLFLALANSKKVPYTDEGIAILQAALFAQLQEGVDVGGLVKDSIVIQAPTAASANPVDKANRILRNLNFTAELAGAIHKVFIQGQIIL